MGGAKKYVPLIHVSNTHTEYGWISSNGLGGDSVTEGRTDRGDCNIPDAFLKKHGDNKKVRAIGKSNSDF